MTYRRERSGRSAQLQTGRHQQQAITDPHGLANKFLKTLRNSVGILLLRFYRGEFWQYDTGRYRRTSEHTVKAALTRTIRAIFKNSDERDRYGHIFKVGCSLLRNVLQALVSIIEVDETWEMPCWLSGKGPEVIPVKNGLLSVPELTSLEKGVNGATVLLRPSPDLFSPVVVPVEYDPKAACPQWLAFLRRVLENDLERIALVQEWFGYCLVFDTSAQKFLLLVGDGANGKSVLVAILEWLLGSANVSHVPLEQFGERFQIATTQGKLANIASEVNEIDKVAEGYLKQFTGGDMMHFERKGRDPISAKPTARLTVCSNHNPSFHDRSQGLWRRMNYVPFNVTIPEGEQDPHLIEKLREELPGILNWALEGLVRYRRQKRFTQPAVCLQALEEYRRESNPAGMFLADRCEAGPNEIVQCEHLYEAYREWCHGHGYRPLNDKHFGKEVRRVFKKGVERRKRALMGDNRVWCYLGISLTPSYQLQSGPDDLEPGEAA
jgi:putative DNA primase/helicase